MPAAETTQFDRSRMARLLGVAPFWQRAGLVAVVCLALLPVLYRITLGRPVNNNSRAVVDGVAPLVLRYMCWGSPQQLDTEREIIRRFNAKCASEGRNVRFELFMPPAGGYIQKAQLMLASDTAPDVMRIDHFNFPSLVPRGYFKDVTDLAKGNPDFKLSDFDPTAMRECMYHDRLYGVNTLYGGTCIYYNKDMFERAGLDDPYTLWKRGEWTWEKFEDVAMRLSTRDANGNPLTFGHVVLGGADGPSTNTWALWVWREGGRIFSPDGTHCTADSPEAIKGVQELHDLIYKMHAAPTPADTSASAFRFEAGNIGMEFNWAGQSPRYRESIKDFRWDIAPIPQSPVPGRAFTMMKGNELVMWSGCKHPVEAWEFMKFMVSPETELAQYGDQNRRCLPTRIAVIDSPEYLQATKPPFHTDVLKFFFENPRELPLDATYGSWDHVATKFMGTLFNHPDDDVGDAMRKMTIAIDQDRARELNRMQRYGADDGDQLRGTEVSHPATQSTSSSGSANHAS